MFQLFRIFTIFSFTITIVHTIFITAIFKLQLFSPHATCLHTRLTEFFLNPITCSVLPFISHVNSLTNSLEFSINVNKLHAVLLLLFICLFPFSIRHFVVACLLRYPFLSDVAIFLFICWTSKQAHYFCFWSLCLSFYNIHTQWQTLN